MLGGKHPGHRERKIAVLKTSFWSFSFFLFNSYCFPLASIQDIQSKKSEISDIEKAINVRKRKINLLNQKIQDIKSGSYKTE